MRKLVLALILLTASRGMARADGLAIGLFVGEPVGLDLVVELQRNRSALDIVLGCTTVESVCDSYAHLTYLHTLGTARGRTVNVPIRLGFGGAVYGITEEDRFAFALRAPLEIGLKFRRSRLEIYGEIAFVLQLFAEGAGDDVDADIDGGIGLRVYF